MVNSAVAPGIDENSLACDWKDELGRPMRNLEKGFHFILRNGVGHWEYLNFWLAIACEYSETVLK